MLFISILLSIWFVAWIACARIFIAWLRETTYEENSLDYLLEKTDNDAIYHLHCQRCNYDWWSIEENVNFCPNCGCKSTNKKDQET